MQEEIISIKNEALAQIMGAKDVAELENLRINYLGRNGKFNSLIKKLKDLSSEEKKEVGPTLNQAKQTIDKLISDKHQELIKILTEKRKWFDLTIPGMQANIGHLHPMTVVLQEIKQIFNYLGYQVADGPEIETDYYNFEALNIPKDHPSRDTQMTFHIDTTKTKIPAGELILRTQTSAMQGRVMSLTKPPFRVLVPGINYRYEQVDASHGFQFWHIEGFVVDKNIHLTDLFGTIEYVLGRIFGPDTKIKFATTNFPFVEPGVDTYIQCTICKGKGCPFCKQTGWSEILPAGMIHPNVLKQAGLDAKKWGGFAFALGFSRIVSLRYKIHDLRILSTPDMRILRQF